MLARDRVLGLGLFLAGVISAAAGWILLRSLGSRYRVGRLLAASPEISIDDAIASARRGDMRFVRVTGRVSSDEEFPDENERPLVYRRKRVEIGTGRGAWSVAADDREAVPFGVETRSSFIAVDTGAIAEGMVVVPRVATGTARDLPPDVAADAGLAPDDADRPARLIVEQVSAVEQATVCGLPSLSDGNPVMTAGLGRPLIVTTLEPAAAMRILAAGHRRRTVAAAGLLTLALVLLTASVLVVALGIALPAVLAASPAPSGGDLFIDPLDPRTGGNASLVGTPLLAALVVVALGVLAAVATAIYTRLAGRHSTF